jgi:hypothetical protein
LLDQEDDCRRTSVRDVGHVASKEQSVRAFGEHCFENLLGRVIRRFDE